MIQAEFLIDDHRIIQIVSVLRVARGHLFVLALIELFFTFASLSIIHIPCCTIDNARLRNAIVTD